MNADKHTQFRINKIRYRMPLFEALQMASLDFPADKFFCVYTIRGTLVGNYARID